ncbi:MAG: GNA1162 family protein [Desulfovibrio sp.]|uniref:GNA1162 family protein n=1 Tax=Desulfovibrio sp. 7SRBS1 TaxID=3378064 RepID=UPI003B3CCC0D
MKSYLFRLFGLLALAGLMLTMGCAIASTKKGQGTLLATSEAFNLFQGEYENTPYFQKHVPRSVAVAPFADLERKSYSIDFDDENPAVIIRRGMYNHISSLPFQDLELQDTDMRLKNAGIKDVKQLQEMLATNPKKLRSILGVDALVTGEVTHFDRIFAAIYSQIAIGCEVKMWDLKSGELLWRAKHVQRSHAGGFSLSPIGLAMATVAAVWNLRESEMFSQTDDLFREIVSTVYVPEAIRKEQIAKPTIDLFAVMNADAPFTAGKKISFRMVGDPSGRAYVDLGDFKRGIELKPVSTSIKDALQEEVLKEIKANYEETGHKLTPELIAAVRKELGMREIYEGTYAVEPGEEAYGLLAKGYLINEAGGQAISLDAVHTVDIDALPPKAPLDLKAFPLDGKISLVWTKNSKADMAHYEVLQSASALSGYVPALTTEADTIIIPDQENFQKTYFQVRAVDKAGNVSPASPSIEAVALPEPDLYKLRQPGPALSGIIVGKALLTPDKSPYTIQAGLSIGKGSVLYVAPGVELKFAPGAGITVDGGSLMVYGQAAHPVRFGPVDKAAEPGAWSGIALQSSKRAILKNVVITKAATGVSVVQSGLTMTGGDINKSSQAAMLLGDNAKPVVTCTRIADNEGQGGLVIEGEGVSPQFTNCVFTNNSPFQVQSYTPLRIELGGNFWGKAKPSADVFLGDVNITPVLQKEPEACPTRAQQ